MKFKLLSFFKKKSVKTNRFIETFYKCVFDGRASPAMRAKHENKRGFSN